MDINYKKLSHQTGPMAAKVLKGEARPTDTAAEHQTEHTTSYSSAVAEQLGVTLPERILKGEGVAAAR